MYVYILNFTCIHSSKTISNSLNIGGENAIFFAYSQLQIIPSIMSIHWYKAETVVMCRQLPLLLYILPLLAQSLTDVLLSVQLASLSLPRLRRDMGLKSRLPSGWGLEDMGMPYRKFERTELLEVAGLDDVTTGAVVFPGPWLLCVMMAVEEL